jgi:hypothetical protein
MDVTQIETREKQRGRKERKIIRIDVIWSSRVVYSHTKGLYILKSNFNAIYLYKVSFFLSFSSFFSFLDKNVVFLIKKL